MPGTLLLRHVRTTHMDATVYEPVLCAILQGSKEVSAGDSLLSIGAGESLIVSHDVPVVSRITSARKGAPYLAVIFSLDVAMLRGLGIGGDEDLHSPMIDRAIARAQARLTARAPDDRPYDNAAAWLQDNLYDRRS